MSVKRGCWLAGFTDIAQVTDERIVDPGAETRRLIQQVLSLPGEDPVSIANKASAFLEFFDLIEGPSPSEAVLEETLYATLAISAELHQTHACTMADILMVQALGRAALHNISCPERLLIHAVMHDPLEDAPYRAAALSSPVATAAVRVAAALI